MLYKLHPIRQDEMNFKYLTIQRLGTQDRRGDSLTIGGLSFQLAFDALQFIRSKALCFIDCFGLILNEERLIWLIG